jgi:tetratricopeptide (TPR) repeat protein
MRKVLILLTLLAIIPHAVISQANTQTNIRPAVLSLGLSPVFVLPSPLDENAGLFSLGGGMEVSGEYLLPFLRSVFAKAGIEYDYSQLDVPDSISLFSGSAGLGIRIPLAKWLTFKATAAGGYYYTFVNSMASSGGAGNAFGSLGLGLSFDLWPSVSLGLSGSYRVYRNLLQTIDASVGVSYALDLTPRTPLVMQDVSFGSVFPIFHAYYDDHPVGRLTLRNGEKSVANDIKVSLFIRQYMDTPKECATIPELKPGETRNIDLYALFKNTILDITQATKVAAEISASYRVKGRAATITRGETIRVYDRNAMTWDDDRKAAAFVTPKEPTVLSFSNNVNALLKGRLNPALDKNLQSAIGLHDALRLCGISYVSNPLTPYAVVSQDKFAVDTLKFPRQTFEYRSGDCSDLSILYCALMESLQVETAFITIPGHIFMAFALKSTEEEARVSFSSVDELIFRDGKVWIPVEVTERTGSFLTAWEEGAKEWAENLAKDQVGFFPLHEAWNTYEPVGLPSSGGAPSVTVPASVVQDFQDDVTRLVNREIYSRVEALQGAITSSQESPQTVNALGVLYARYGLVEKAQREFERALARSEYLPALVNMGNLYYQKSDPAGALAYYQRAYRLSPRNARVLLCVVRASRELQNYDAAQKAYSELEKVDPNLAKQNAYLALKGEQSTRAAKVGAAEEAMSWVEE